MYNEPRAQIRAQVTASDRTLALRVVKAMAHSLAVEFDAGVEVPSAPFSFDALSLVIDASELQLGAGRFTPHPESWPKRRRDDPAPLPGHGQVTFSDAVYDFNNLFGKGRVANVAQRIEQLPLTLNRKNGIRPEFRDYAAAAVYDLQVYRAIFDDIDRGLDAEQVPIRDEIRAQATDLAYASFCALFDDRLQHLEQLTRGFDKQQHEQHGFYFRKQVWDLILASAFIARTNLKPRGYAGDSEMMRMVYERDFRGDTIFARFMHRHPIETAAAQAVRNRIVLLAQLVREAYEQRPAGQETIRIMSVACGPSRELRNVISSAEDVDNYRFVLLDQDDEALGEAAAELAQVEARTGRKPSVEFVRESVRTMLRTPDLAGKLGRCDFVYSMGLFDYLTRPVAKAVLTKLYEVLAPGGQLVIGNYHVDNPTRVYMEYWMDWVLLYRTEAEFLDLAADLRHAECSIEFEQTRSQMFLRVKKRG